MKKILLIIPIIIILIILLEIINLNTDKDINIDIQKLGEELANSQIFEDSLSIIDKDIAIRKYSLDNKKINDMIAYEGSGATAEEIIIIKLNNKNNKTEIKEIIKTKIQERKSDFENYLPKEVFKLDNYILESKGNYIILCISNDFNMAKEIIAKYINS